MLSDNTQDNGEESSPYTSMKYCDQFLENIKYDGVRKLIKSFNSVPYREHNVKYANQELHIYI